MNMREKSASDSLCIAHLSDPHLTSLHGARWWQLINKRWLGYRSWRRKRRDQHSSEVLDALLQDLRATCPEHVLITGDLTHIALPDEFRQARRWLDRLGSGETVSVIPGNHDAYVRTAWRKTWAHWLPYMESDPAWRSPGRGRKLFPSLRVRNGVALIGLSSAVPTAPLVANGRLGARQRERLVRILRQTGERGLFRLVFLHHPPRPQDENWRRRLTDGSALCEILCREGAELVLHGHGHINARTSIDCASGEIPVYGIPSASAVGHKPGHCAQYYVYRLLRAQGHWQVQVNVRGWQPEAGVFAPVGEHQLRVPAMPSTNC